MNDNLQEMLDETVEKAMRYGVKCAIEVIEVWADAGFPAHRCVQEAKRCFEIEPDEVRH